MNPWTTINYRKIFLKFGDNWSLKLEMYTIKCLQKWGNILKNTNYSLFRKKKTEILTRIRIFKHIQACPSHVHCSDSGTLYFHVV